MEYFIRHPVKLVLNGFKKLNIKNKSVEGRQITKCFIKSMHYF